MENVGAETKKEVWDSIMKCMNWQGYKTDDELMAVKSPQKCSYFLFVFTKPRQDIHAIRTAHAGRNLKLNECIKTLTDNRRHLCAFHTKKLFSFGKTSSQLSESFNAQTKGGRSVIIYSFMNS